MKKTETTATKLTKKQEKAARDEAAKKLASERAARVEEGSSEEGSSEEGDTSEEKRAKREGNIQLMSRLLIEGVSEASILKQFTERYAGQGVAHKTGDWVEGRVRIYAKIAMRDAKVAAAVEGHRSAKPAKKTKKAAQ